MPRAVAVDAPVGLLLFASTQDEPRARRPTDVALVITGVVLLLLAATFSEIGGDIDVAIADALASLPGFFDPLWLVLAWTPVAWGVVLIVVSLLRGRRALARDLVAGVVVVAADRRVPRRPARRRRVGQPDAVRRPGRPAVVPARRADDLRRRASPPRRRISAARSATSAGGSSVVSSSPRWSSARPCRAAASSPSPSG